MDALKPGPEKGNYLSRMGRGEEKRRWERRECNIIVGIMYTGKGLRQLCKAQIRLENISEGGALASTKKPGTPDHFNMFFGEYQYYVGCSVVNRMNGRIALKFTPEQPTEFVNIIGRISDPFEFLQKIRPSLYGLPTLPTMPTIATNI